MLPGAHRQVHERAGGRWAIYWYASRGGAQIARFEGATLAEAEDAELKGAADIAGAYAEERKPRAPIGTVARAIGAFLGSAEWAAMSKATQRGWRRWLDAVREKWGGLSGKDFASDETAAEIRVWRDELALTSPAQADKAMEAVSRFCSYARQRSVKLLPRDCNPTEDIKKAYVRPVQLPPGRAAVLDAIAALPDLASAACDIAHNSGLRCSDLVRLSDTHIDEEAGIVRLGTTKGRRKRRVVAIRLTPPLLAAIRRAQAIRDALYERKRTRARYDRKSPPVKPLTVLVNRSCLPFTPNGLYQHIKSAFDAAGRERIAPHGFRRAAATQRFKSGLSWAQIGRELGWGESEAETMGAVYVPDEAIG